MNLYVNTRSTPYCFEAVRHIQEIQIMEIATGATRTVILTKNWAFKLPVTFYAKTGGRGFWYRLLQGLLCNMCEKEFSGHKWQDFPYKCAKVHFYIPGGWLVVMRRGKSLSLDDFIDLYNSHPKYGRLNDDLRFGPADENSKFWPELVVCKSDSFKFIDGELQVVDYGSSTERRWNWS